MNYTICQVVSIGITEFPNNKIMRLYYYYSQQIIIDSWMHSETYFHLFRIDIPNHSIQWNIFLGQTDGAEQSAKQQQSSIVLTRK